MDDLGSIVLFVYKFLKYKQNIWKMGSKIAEAQYIINLYS